MVNLNKHMMTYPFLPIHHQIHQLKEGFSGHPIRICIRNTWDTKIHEPVNPKKCIGFVCYDCHGVLLEGHLTTSTDQTGPNLLTEGDTYEISVFFVQRNLREGKLTRLPYTICINQWSKMLNISMIDPIISEPPFSPRYYKSLIRLATTPRYLPDVVGQILQMQNLRPSSSEWIGKITIALRLNDSKIIRIALWGDPKREFNTLQNKKNRKWKIVLITSLIPKLYQGRLELSSSPTTTFYFNKTLQHIKNYGGQIGSLPRA